jgi:MFS family permease
VQVVDRKQRRLVRGNVGGEPVEAVQQREGALGGGFLLGVGGFTAASLLCGLAWSSEVLIAARVAQGAMAALMMPQILSTTQATFPAGERPKAYGRYVLSSRRSLRARRSLPRRRRSTPSGRRRSATWRLRRGSPCR